MKLKSSRIFTSYTPDELRELYKTDPTRFDKLAAAAIENACIGSTEEQGLKLRQMQWVIDGQLRKQKTPQQRLHEMQRIFYDGLYGSDGLIYKLNAACLRLTELMTRPGNAGCKEPGLRVVKKGEA